MMLSIDQVKEKVGREAAQLIQPGMTVGIGTGSTAFWFIHFLAERIQAGLSCRGVPTSVQTKLLAESRGIPLAALHEVSHIDLAIDGADEISPHLDLIKGGGGALLEEKRVATAAQKLIIIADETKIVAQLGKFPLPVEVIPGSYQQVKKQIELIGCKAVLLRESDKKIFITDHGHYILDCHFQKITNPIVLHDQLNNIPGVVENGLFIDLADHALIGYTDGTIRKLLKRACWF